MEIGRTDGASDKVDGMAGRTAMDEEECYKDVVSYCRS